MVTPAHLSRRSLGPGDKLGKYEVIRQIAVGGMAELYLARASGVEGFEKLVCVKRILSQYADNPSFVLMFLNEARLAATLHHPNITQVYDIGQAGGEYFFSMEYVHGEDLGRLVTTARENGVPISLDCALTLASGLCAGLHHAHEKASPEGKPLGVVHRDVSPTNVLVSYDGAVKLVDFGIARAAGRPSSTIGLKGKIAYMSPEQCRGKVALDRRSDVFSIGTILYELTTGRLPFTDETEYGVLQQIVNRDAEPPSAFVPGYPPALEAIVMRALAREADRRCSTALELQNQLEDFAHDNRLRVSPLVVARLMSTLFPARLEEWDHARAQGAFFVEQHVVRTLIESGKTPGPSRHVPQPLPPPDDEVDDVLQAGPAARGSTPDALTQVGVAPPTAPARMGTPPPTGPLRKVPTPPAGQAKVVIPPLAGPGRTAPASQPRLATPPVGHPVVGASSPGGQPRAATPPPPPLGQARTSPSPASQPRLATPPVGQPPAGTSPPVGQASASQRRLAPPPPVGQAPASQPRLATPPPVGQAPTSQPRLATPPPVGQSSMATPPVGQAPMPTPPMAAPPPVGQGPTATPPTIGHPTMGNPTTGHPAPGQAPAGQVAPGHTAPGQVAPGQAPAGQVAPMATPPPGQAPMGQAPPPGQSRFPTPPPVPGVPPLPGVRYAPMPVPSVPGAVPIMTPMVAPPVASAGTLVSSALQTGSSSPIAAPAPVLPGAPVARQMPSTPADFGLGDPARSGVGPAGYGAYGGPGSPGDAARISGGYPAQMPQHLGAPAPMASRSGSAQPTLIIRVPRRSSWVPMFAVAAACVVGAFAVVLVLNNRGETTSATPSREPAGATRPSTGPAAPPKAAAPSPAAEQEPAKAPETAPSPAAGPEAAKGDESRAAGQEPANAVAPSAPAPAAGQEPARAAEAAPPSPAAGQEPAKATQAAAPSPTAGQEAKGAEAAAPSPTAGQEAKGAKAAASSGPGKGAEAAGSREAGKEAAKGDEPVGQEASKSAALDAAGKQAAKDASSGPRGKPARPKIRPDAKRADPRRAPKAEPKEKKQWNDESPFLPVHK